MAIERYHLGCPEWGDKDWKGTLFSAKAAPRDFLSQYASVFNTVEGNTTFYALPKAETVERWREDTPDTFRFCFKFPKWVSHQGALDARQTASFYKVLQPLEGRLGPFFLQLPPHFGASRLDELARFLEGQPREFRYAVEVRNLDFFDKGENERRFEDVLRRFDTDRTVFDTRELNAATLAEENEEFELARRRKPKMPVRFQAIARHPFLRFIGHPKNEKNDDALVAWAETVGGWIAEGRDPFVFIHTYDDVRAPELAERFHELLGRFVPDAGEFPARPSGGTQMTLF